MTTHRLAPLLLAAACMAPTRVEAVTLRNLELMAHRNDYPPPAPTAGNWNYSACWSYIHPDGREYAAIGVGTGTAIYNVTDPAATYPVGFIPGPPSKWREMKQYRNWLYVVTEGYGVGEGLQIVRMTDPEHPVLAATYVGGFARSHTVSVDTSRALLICNGTRSDAGAGAYPFAGMRVLSLADPEAPAEIATWPPGPVTPASEDSVYVHDSVPVGNLLYACSVYYGIQRVFDFTDPANPIQIAAWRYPGGFTHNCWPDKTGRWLYVTDEKNGEPLKIFDISNLGSPVLFNRFTDNPAAIVHNVHVRGDEIFLSNYTEGIRILDASDPAHPAEFAFADSYDGPSGNYDGVWEVCPYFPSGTVIASDMESGLWVYRPRRDYGLVRVRVIDAGSGLPIEGATLYRDAAAESLSTTADGVSVFAMDPGGHTVTARSFGYADASFARTAAVGSRDTVTLALTPLPKTSFGGTVRAQTPLQDAEVTLAYTPLHAHTNNAGHFSLAGVPVGTYRIEVRCPGYVPVAFTRDIGPSSPSMTFQLAPVAVWDPVETGAGWTVGAPSDDATTNAAGQWTLVDPLGTVVDPLAPATRLEPQPVPAPFGRPGVPLAHESHGEAEGLAPGPVQPEDDRTPSGTRCFVTGQGTSASDIEGYDLDGVTTLESPVLDASAMTVPTLGFWRWFFTSTADPGDHLDVFLSNDAGGTWTWVRRIEGCHVAWEEEAVRIADYLAPTSRMKARFVASEQGSFSVVEAGIDDLTLYDAASSALGAVLTDGRIPVRLALGPPWPNPASGRVSAVLELPARGRVEAEVLDLSGRRVAKVFDGDAEAGTLVLAWDGRDARGRNAGAGVYFLRVRGAGAVVSARCVKLR